MNKTGFFLKINIFIDKFTVLMSALAYYIVFVNYYY